MLVICAALALFAAGAGLARMLDDEPTPSRSASPTTVPTRQVGVDPALGDEPVAEVAELLAPAVVQLETDDGLGSGFIYDPDGHILTAAHVLQGGGRIVQVRLADGSVREGRVIGTDDATDVGVVKIEPFADMAIATLATGVELQVGQLAVAIGSPFGLDQTVTAGIISSVSRPQQTPGGAIDMIQTDAPINPGNSGGPLADRAGRVIGINDQIATSTGENAGIGFAVPIDLAKAVADKLVAGEPVEFAFLGVRTQGAGSGLVGDGAVVVTVEPGSPADDAGLEQGDRITAIDGSPVRDPVELGARVRSYQPGDDVTLSVRRGGDDREISVTLGSTND